MLSVVFISLRTRRLCLGSLQPRQWDCSAVFDQRMGCFVFGFVCKKSYERKQTELISFPLIYVWWKQTMTVSSVISFARLFHIFVHLFQCLHFSALEQSFPAQRPQVGLSSRYVKITILLNPWSSQVGPTLPGSPGPCALWFVCHFVPHRHYHFLCVPRQLNVWVALSRAQCLSALSLYHLHRLAQC